ncbi:hypothetical protein PCANC_14502 [Puccinia coronata f. sp. avenae]|uniref:Endopeptidase S2P n=1 Tax=Puccinia coronata f. sp. avenae TaxID=200324 RepID=A0A2N5SLW8_9BASI|nr:hypothetical protein PCANC_14502 [Puccinia coronata f. sp. avenae]PLW46017.1 hypothetical protein PCASD_03491 [Puccinia coronata f. sp. avenae]
MGKMYNLSFTLKQTSPAPDYDNLSYAAFTAPRQLVKRAKLPTPETISYPHPAGIQSNRSTDLKKEADPMPLQLTIPGLTIPLSTLPKFLIALIVSQIIHEVGHAFAAAMNSVSLQSVGFYVLFPLIPVCYVSTLAQCEKKASGCHDRLTHLKNLRVATAGIWHNLVLASVSWLAWNGGFNLFDSSLGRVFWKDINNNGAMVARVAEMSTLRPHLNPRDLVVQIDGISLQGGGSLYSSDGNDFVSAVRWDSYLSQAGNSSDSSEPLKGWCFSDAEFQKFPSECCPGSNPNITRAVQFPVCFQTRKYKQDPSTNRCLDYEQVTKLASHQRCKTNVGCFKKDTCIQLTPGQNLVLIRTLAFKTGASNTILYSGSRDLLRQEVNVTSLMPRYAFISPSLILNIHETLSFLISLSLGLAFVNLLPITNFDGSAIYQLLLLFKPFNIKGRLS